MSTLSDLLAEHTDVSGRVAAHLQQVVAEWQLLADLSFADFHMYVRADDGSIICVAQCRPNTAPTVHPRDEVGSVVLDAENPQVAQAFSGGRILREEDPTWIGQTALRREAVPVRFDGAVVAVLVRSINLSHLRMPSPLELSYQDCANDLCQMVSEGTFPQDEGNPRGLSTPRAGDGFIRVDAQCRVVYASPNAQSAYHRMGWQRDLAGQDLAEVTASLLTDRFESDDARRVITAAVGGKAGMRMEADARRASVLIRALPLVPRGQVVGAAVLVRDVTEVKRRDRALISKDATIREIHHRVKNNLQSVSALLRLQARRTSNAEARTALDEAVRRVASIALVHEMLSGSVDEEVDLDEVIDRLLPIMTDVAPGAGRPVVRREGTLGVFASEMAMPIVMVLTELIQNAVEHGYRPGETGEVVIAGQRSTRKLSVVVRDDGAGLPEGFDPHSSDRLGLQIVHTLAEIELGGTLEIRNRESAETAASGAEALLTVPLR
ncbi:PAS domain-containing sensor histidine kinase [Gordonia jinhuaensis]|uniref:histidine kinase n=1 Tax=Gordonia jinhuaensis TaxID=1517702 RepID=A0A916T7A5_9ACTN|nr:PAS domain-containing sensor histidine kinase [Gordonia jinhuaensis]GGB34627.1 ATPase [Gordonia jinhuaensis]